MIQIGKVIPKQFFSGLQSKSVGEIRYKNRVRKTYDLLIFINVSLKLLYRILKVVPHFKSTAFTGEEGCTESENNIITVSYSARICILVYTY